MNVHKTLHMVNVQSKSRPLIVVRQLFRPLQNQPSIQTLTVQIADFQCRIPFTQMKRVRTWKILNQIESRLQLAVDLQESRRRCTFWRVGNHFRWLVIPKWWTMKWASDFGCDFGFAKIWSLFHSGLNETGHFLSSFLVLLDFMTPFRKACKVFAILLMLKARLPLL